MKMQFEVEYADGRKVQAAAGPRDFVAFERQYDHSIAGFGDATGLRMEWIYYLAWSPLHRGGQEPSDFDTFLNNVEDVSPVEDGKPAAAADPSAAEVTPAVS
jgi:hypothetical protein